MKRPVEVVNKYKTETAIFAIAILSRWLALFLGWLFSGTEQSFFENVYDTFIKAGDTPHYIEIAKNWYVSGGEKANLIVFFPLYPILIRVVQTVAGSYFAAGLIVSNVSWGIGACVFYKLLRLDYNEDKSAYGLFAFLLFPFSFFGAAVYTEGLFMMLTVMSLYFMRGNKWLAAGICGLLCSLTRMQGIVLMFVFLYEFAIDGLKNKNFNSKAVAAAALTAVGFCIYLIINKVVHGEWFKYLEFQAAAPWYNKAQWIGSNLKQHYDMALEHEGLALYIYWPQIILFFGGVLALFYGLHKNIRTSYIVYGGVYMAATYIHGWLISGGRYMAMCMPMFIILAAVDNVKVRNIILAFFGLMYIVLAALWLKGYAIM